jgi:hypothetical protein
MAGFVDCAAVIRYGHGPGRPKALILLGSGEWQETRIAGVILNSKFRYASFKMTKPACSRWSTRRLATLRNRFIGSAEGSVTRTVARFGSQVGWHMTIWFAHHAFPTEIIRHAIWLCVRFALSYRDVKDLLAERGLDIS